MIRVQRRRQSAYASSPAQFIRDFSPSSEIFARHQGFFWEAAETGLRRPHLHIQRIKRSLAADVEPVALQTAETDVGDKLADWNCSQVGSVRRVAEHIAAGRCPDIAVAVTAESVE